MVAMINHTRLYNPEHIFVVPEDVEAYRRDESEAQPCRSFETPTHEGVLVDMVSRRWQRRTLVFIFSMPMGNAESRARVKEI